eukprot:s1778_g5.t1
MFTFLFEEFDGHNFRARLEFLVKTRHGQALRPPAGLADVRTSSTDSAMAGLEGAVTDSRARFSLVLDTDIGEVDQVKLGISSDASEDGRAVGFKWTAKRASSSEALWCDGVHAQLHRGRSMITAAPRFSCSGVEALVQGSAFAAVALWSLTWALWQSPGPGSCEMNLQSRAVLWTCAGLSLLSACLGLVEMDLTLSDTAAASLSARPGRAFPLHFGLRALEAVDPAVGGSLEDTPLPEGHQRWL